MQILTLLSSIAALGFLREAHGYTYPSSVNDTSARQEPFALAVSEITTAAYAYKNVQLTFVNSTKSKDLGVYINPVNIVGQFTLKNGSLQVASSKNYYATLQPLPTIDGIKRHSFTFTTNETEKSNAWQLISVSNEGIFGLLNQDASYAKFNGFTICNTSQEYFFEVEYQSSPTGKKTKGCEPIALHTFMGPPY